MSHWKNKNVFIKQLKIEVNCEEIIHKTSASDYLPTMIGQVESKNTGELTLILENADKILSQLNHGILSFNDDGRMQFFNILRILSKNENSITFSVAPPE